MLKIVAYLDRPHVRERDLDDLNAIFARVLDDADERRWDEPLVSTGIDHAHQGACLIGSQVGALLRTHHRERVDAFVDLVRDRNGLPFSRMLRSVPFGEKREAFLVERLDAFVRGLDSTRE